MLARTGTVCLRLLTCRQSLLTSHGRPVNSIPLTNSVNNSTVPRRSTAPSVFRFYNAFVQWLNYKFGGPGTLKNLGPYCKLKGAPLNLLAPLTAVWGLGKLANNF